MVWIFSPKCIETNENTVLWRSLTEQACTQSISEAAEDTVDEPTACVDAPSDETRDTYLCDGSQFRHLFQRFPINFTGAKFLKNYHANLIIRYKPHLHPIDVFNACSTSTWVSNNRSASFPDRVAGKASQEEAAHGVSAVSQASAVRTPQEQSVPTGPLLWCFQIVVTKNIGVK